VFYTTHVFLIYPEVVMRSLVSTSGAVSPAPNQPVPLGEYLTSRQASALLSVSVKQLENWRRAGTGGPPFHKLGKLVRYSIADVRTWAANRRVHSVAQGNALAEGGVQ
jgi:hypothetical protein